MKTTEELRRELHEAELREQQEREAKKRTVKRKWQFTLLPTTQSSPSCVMYTLKGEVVNQEECRQAGWSGHEVQNGSMNYLYNTLSGRIIMAVGGGRVFIDDGALKLDGKAREQGNQAIAELGDFLHSHPHGGDVTEIVLRQDNMKCTLLRYSFMLGKPAFAEFLP